MEIFEILDKIKTMTPYDPERSCVKCGNDKVTSRYSEGHYCGKEDCSDNHPEYILRTCLRCRYQWLEAVADSVAE